MKVEFKYDIFKDGSNILRVFSSLGSFDIEDQQRRFQGLDPVLVEKINNKEDDIDKQEVIADFLFNDFLPKNKDDIKRKINDFSERWNNISEEYFKRLGEILNIKIPDSNIYMAYITNVGSCPYNVRENWFMVRFGREEDVVNVAAHEIMHIEFEKVYWIHCKNLNISPKKFGDIKEALTVLLNEEMSNLLPRPDYGYKEHQDLREKIKEIWKEEKDIKKLLDKLA